MTPAMKLALAGSHQGLEGAAELLRFAREGAGIRGAFETDVAEQLLDAAKIAIDIELAAIEVPKHQDRAVALTKLRDEIATFLDGWA